MPIHLRTKCWNDPVAPDDGQRLLVCRYRPRGVRKEDETWDGWVKELAPSKELHAAYWGKSGPPIAWEEYARRYLDEMKAQTWRLDALADQLAAGERLTLLCSSACLDEERCHRTLLRRLLEERVAQRRR